MISLDEDLDTLEMLGKKIYLTGTTTEESPLTAYIGPESIEVPGSSVVLCVNCQRLDGHGKPEGAIDPAILSAAI